jgi:hypothetical protein
MLNSVYLGNIFNTFTFSLGLLSFVVGSLLAITGIAGGKKRIVFGAIIAGFAAYCIGFVISQLPDMPPPLSEVVLLEIIYFIWIFLFIILGGIFGDFIHFKSKTNK